MLIRGGCGVAAAASIFLSLTHPSSVIRTTQNDEENVTPAELCALFVRSKRRNRCQLTLRLFINHFARRRFPTWKSDRELRPKGIRVTFETHHMQHQQEQ
jgi:hypothetical protein